MNSCGVRYAAEVQVDTVDEAPPFQSKLLRPYHDAEVSVGLVKNEAQCNQAEWPRHCAVLKRMSGQQ